MAETSYFHADVTDRSMLNNDHPSLDVPLLYLAATSYIACFEFCAHSLCFSVPGGRYLQLRDSNGKLKAEVMALRAYMEQRGVMPEGGEVQGDLSGRLTVPSPSSPPPILLDETAAQPTSKRPPPKVPREARMAALALLLSAAVVAGGVFVPIAIGEGAARVMRWLDDGGTLAPKSLRRNLAGYGRFSMLPTIRRRQKQWCLSYVPFLESGTIAPHMNDRLGSPGDALTGAWNELMPSR